MWCMCPRRGCRAGPSTLFLAYATKPIDVTLTSLLPPLAFSGKYATGMFFTEHHEDSQQMAPSYRHLLIRDATAAPKHFYHLNAEHAIADANVEVRSSADVKIFSLKSEGRVRVGIGPGVGGLGCTLAVGRRPPGTRLT